MPLLALLPFIVIIIFGSWAAARVKASTSSQGKLALFWILVLAVPFALQAVAAKIFCPPFGVTSLHWILIDAGIPLPDASYIVEALWRTSGALVGLAVVWAVWAAESVSLRWVAVSLFVLSTTLNYLDRNLLGALSPLIMKEFHFEQIGYGWLISAFSLTYAVSSLGAGWALDRFGVNRTIYAAAAWWSSAAVGTGLVNSFFGLGVCRSALGIGESAGISAVGKLNAVYLKPEERALGAALNQIGISVGSSIAVYWGVHAAGVHGWRWPFMLAGFCGFAWIPVWWLVNRAIPAQFQASELVSDQERRDKPSFAILRERNLILLVVANLLWMGGYSLWSSWTTLYLIHVHNLTLEQSRDYAYIPPLVSNVGGFFGGWLSLYWAKKAASMVEARRRAVWVGAVCSLVTLFLPLATDPRWATALISASFFFALAGSVNIYALPIDIYGAKRSGMALAALTCSYGLLQTVISPIIGYLSDHKLYTEVVWLVTLPLLLSALVLQGLSSRVTVRPL